MIDSPLFHNSYMYFNSFRSIFLKNLCIVTGNIILRCLSFDNKSDMCTFSDIRALIKGLRDTV